MRRGFSLIEILITLGLLSVIFVVAADLARDFSTLHRADSEITRKANASREVLKFLSRQARSALTVAAPGATLTLSSLDQTVPIYPPLPLAAGATAPAGWEPDQPRLTTTYQMNGTRLESSSGAITSVLIGDITGFQANRVGSLLTLSVSWQQGRRVKTSESKVYLSVRSYP